MLGLPRARPGGGGGGGAITNICFGSCRYACAAKLVVDHLIGPWTTLIIVWRVILLHVYIHITMAMSRPVPSLLVSTVASMSPAGYMPDVSRCACRGGAWGRQREREKHLEDPEADKGQSQDQPSGVDNQ